MGFKVIYLTTGANGAGKTLFTLKDVREQQIKENRPVYYHGFEAGETLVSWGWLPFEPEKWQDLPDGSICIFDECQNELPAKLAGAVPDWINAIAQFRRKRGFDFWLITPHPSLIHINVRRLIENPSWHRHFKRTFGSDMVSQLKFNAPNMNCEKPGAGSSGQISMRPFPKEVYNWYKSSSLHTGKKAIPKQVYFLGAIVLLVPLLGYLAFGRMMPKAKPVDALPTSSPAPLSSAARAFSVSAVLSAADYSASFIPRIDGLPGTAPRYDALNLPTQAPKIAACILGKRPNAKNVSCECWSQQATKLDVKYSICSQIALGGFFDDTAPPLTLMQNALLPASPSQPAEVLGPTLTAISSTPIIVASPAVSTVTRDAQVLASMRKREYVK